MLPVIWDFMLSLFLLKKKYAEKNTLLESGGGGRDLFEIFRVVLELSSEHAIPKAMTNQLTFPSYFVIFSHIPSLKRL